MSKDDHAYPAREATGENEMSETSELFRLSPTNEKALQSMLEELPNEYREIANRLIRNVIQQGRYEDKWMLEIHGDNEFLARAFEGHMLEFFVIPRKGHRLFMYVA